MEILIKNGNIINPDNSQILDILIQNGHIAQVGKNLKVAVSQTRVIDASDRYIFPGGIDPHVHLHLPTPAGFSSDDFYSGSRAALFGGTTTLIDFVTPHRGQSLVDALVERKAEAASSLIATYFHVSPVEWRDSTADEILECVHEYGIKSFKCYMAYKNNIGLDDDDLFKVMLVVGKAGGLVMLHCEDGDAIERLRHQYAQREMPAAKAHLMSRPPELEAEAVKTAIALAKKAKCPIYIVHVSSLLSLAHIKEAQKNGQQVYAETCPQYLLLDKSKYDLDFEKAAAFVMSPPLRTTTDNEALWEALAKGSIATVGTDHCPFMLKQKMVGKSDFRKIPNGAGGIEHRLALLFSYGYLKNKINLQRFVDLTSTRASQIFGLFPQKGILAEGANADLLIWNPKTANIISSQSHHQNCDLNIYEGFPTIGHPEIVIADGKIRIENGKLI